MKRARAKKVMSIWIALAMMISLISGVSFKTNANTTNIVFGDVTGDGIVSFIDDIVRINNYVLGKVIFTEEQKILADVNGDGNVDNNDVELLNDARITEDYGSLPIYDLLIDSGYCGENIKYMLKKDGTLTIFGKGEMNDYNGGSLVPWSGYRDRIKNVVICEGVTSVGKLAFYECKFISNITIPNGVMRIGKSAFEECENLNNISIPKGVTSVEDSTFYNCTNLEYIELHDGVIDIGDNAFEGCNRLKNIVIPKGVVNIGAYSFLDCNNLVNIQMFEGIKNIGYGAFANCSGLKSVLIPESVISIEDFAFADCKNLEEIIIKNAYSEIYDSKSTIPALTTIKGHKNSTAQQYAITYKRNFINIDDNVKPTCSISSSNDIATSQKVTLKMYDEEEIAGYYWGTNSNYSNNTYTATSSSSVMKTVSSNGIYYLTVKDTNGNISDTVSVTFYKITLNSNGGSVSPTSVIAKSGNSISLPIPARSGYTFKGWSISSGTTSGSFANVSPSGNVTYYATWEEDINPEISLVTVTNTIEVNQMTTLTAITTPEDTSVIWKSSNENVATVDGGVVIGKNYGFSVITASFVYQGKTYSKSFTINVSDQTNPVGSISATNNVATSQDVTLTLTDNVGVAGYYWGKNNKYSNNVYTKSSDNSVIETISTEGIYYLTVVDTSGNVSNTVSVTFYRTTLDANDGTVIPGYVITKSGNSFTLPIPEKNDYVFKGWSSNNNATSGGVVNVTPSNNGTYYATWSYVDSQKPTGSIFSTNNVDSSQTVTLKFSDNVGIAGYYWGTNSSYLSNTYTATGSSSVAKIVSSGGTYYLTVEDTSGNLSDTVSVTFYKTGLNTNGGSVSPSYVITKSGNSFILPTPTRSGYIFNGWSASSEAVSGNVTSVTPTGNKMYYATWSYIDSTKPIGAISSTNNVATEQTVTLNLSDNVGVAGYYWGTSSNYLSNTYTEAALNNVTKNVTESGTYYLTVKDTSGNISDTVSVTFYKTILNANNGSVSPSYVITKSGNSFTLPTPTRSGYIFNGWSASSSETSGNITSCTPTSNTTYYPTWEGNTYSIYYDANYGSGAPTIQVKKTDETVFISTTIPVRSGYTFIGWSINNNSTAAQYKSGDSYSENADITLYAVWRKQDSSTDSGSQNSGNSSMDSNNQNNGNSSVDSDKKNNGNSIEFVNQNGNTNSTEKGVQNIVAKSITKAYSKKSFRLNAKSTGDGTLSYKSSNNKIVKVSSLGKVTMKGYGKVSITITASETSKYKLATKKIILTVKPKKAKLSRVTSSSKETIKITWKKDKLATGYVVQISNSKRFKKGVLQRYFTKSQKSISVPLKNKSGKKYYVWIRSYKRVNGVDSYGKWSKTKYVIIK